MASCTMGCLGVWDVSCVLCLPVLQVEGMEWLVDAFNQGELTALEDAEEVLSRLMGARVSSEHQTL